MVRTLHWRVILAGCGYFLAFYKGGEENLTTRLGLHLTPSRIRAVKFARRGARCEVFELDWDPAEPAEAAVALREQMGASSAVAIAVDMGFTFVKRVKLPPVPLEERRRILALEPERYFPVRGEGVVVSLRNGSDLVFGVRESQLESWIAELGALGSIELVEPAPFSLARALKSSELEDAAVLLPAEDDVSVGLVEVVEDEVRGARRLPGTIKDALADLAADGWSPAGSRLVTNSQTAAEEMAAAWPDVDVSLLPQLGHCPAEYAMALGAVRGIGETTDAALTTAELAQRWVWRERRRLAGALIALVAALVLLGFGVDRYRERTRRVIEAEIAELGARGQGVVALQAEAERMRGDLETLTEIIDSRMDPLEVLLSVSQLLPDGAYVRSIQGSGLEWRIDGYARDAANLIPTFESSTSFEEVRFVRATTRVRLGNANYEDFSLALRHVPQP